MNPALKIYKQVIQGLRSSEVWEKNAALQQKTANDQAVFALLKHAAAGAITKYLGSPLVKGLMYGTGAAIPVAGAGALLINQAGRESRETTKDIRNKALQAALGIAGIGGSLYALHRATKPTTKTTTAYTRGPDGELTPMKQMQTKVSETHEDPGTLVEKLATAGFLDVLFEQQRASANVDMRTKAAECQALNAEHAVDILRQLLI